MSKHAKLNAQKRDVIGNSVRIMRRNGETPAVVYSKTFNSLPVTVNSRELMMVYKNAGRSKVIELDIDGTIQPVIVKDIDSHPFKYIIRHVDFYAVDLKKEVESLVPVILVNQSPAVKNTGAILNQQINEISVLALPDNIPSQIEVDISSLVEFSDVIKVSNLATSKKYTIVEDLDSIIVSLASQSTQIPETEGENKPISEIEGATPPADNKKSTK